MTMRQPSARALVLGAVPPAGVVRRIRVDLAGAVAVSTLSLPVAVRGSAVPEPVVSDVAIAARWPATP